MPEREDIALGELRAELAGLRSGGPSVRRAAMDLAAEDRAAPTRSPVPPPSRTTIGKILKCATLPSADLLATVVGYYAGKKQLDAAAEVERCERLRRRAATAREAGRARVVQAARPDVTVHAEKWVRHLDQNEKGDTAASLLADKLSEDADSPAMTVLMDLNQLLDLRFFVLVVPVYDGRPVRVKNLSEVAVVLLVDLVLYARRAADRQWLAKQTEVILDADTPAAVGRLTEVWRRLFDVYLSADHALRRDFLRAAVLHSAAGPDSADAKVNRLLRAVRFLRDIIDAGPDEAARRDGREVIQRALEEYPHAARLTAAAHRIQKAVRLLIDDDAAGPALRSPASPLRSRLDVVGGICVGGYTFEAMRYPLTNEQAAHIFDLDGDPGRPRHPYLINPDLRDPIRIRNVCDELDPDPRWVWSLPTPAEWVAMAGCEDLPFPWGGDPPTGELANLTYGAGSGRGTEPVDRRPLAGSWHGTYDCCGNVHELVVDGRPDAARPRYLLAGGSFRTVAELARCQRMRTMSAGSGVPRGNVGLRLVRFDSAVADAATREADGRRFVLKLTQGTGSRSFRTLLATVAHRYPPGSDPAHDAVIEAVRDAFHAGARPPALAQLVRHLLATGRRVPYKAQQRIRTLAAAWGVTEITAAELDAVRAPDQ